MCAFGAPSKKPTTFVASGSWLSQLARSCPGKAPKHQHVVLQGRIWHEGKFVFATKLVLQVYPVLMCNCYATCAEVVGVTAAKLTPLDLPVTSSPALADLPVTSVPVQASGSDPFGLGSSNLLGSQFQLSLTLTTSPAERKRPLGTPCRFEEHRQARSGSQAVQAGYQMRRVLVKPFFSLEVEPSSHISRKKAIIAVTKSA